MSDTNARIEKKHKLLPAKILKNECDNLYVKTVDKSVIVNIWPQNSEEIVTSEERIKEERYSPKRYVTTCYFQPKQLPVWYSETMILNIGSTKKKYFESIYYKNKLSVFHWTESIKTIIPGSEDASLINSAMDIPISKPEFHYISLEPQQIRGMTK
ncbi:rab gdp/gtp exchange factor [Holotrichia oblita]|uniref:Rab gdp/gtp exchange factor n=1 Tax=Holotrichia oblita TaxID=644536 RepID=A0ACB9T5X2_HOLOL|nr:rab gdp/gtp exchange factor [Holotrichia oblita]